MTDKQEREAEIVRLDLQLLMNARNRATPDDDYHRAYVQRNALIWDYGKTYGTEAQERLREMLDEAREKFQARAQELEEAAGIKDTDEVGELRKQVTEFYRTNNQKADQIHDIKRRILDELYNFPVLELLDVLLELQQREARKGGLK
jgi:Mg2+ and Co2+ transporter CorA